MATAMMPMNASCHSHHVHSFDSNGGGNITRERAASGLLQNRGRGLNQTFEEGHTHVCILRGVKPVRR